MRPTQANAATDSLIEQANASGQALFTRTVLDGRSVLRVSIGSRTTTRRHVLDAWDLLSATLSRLTRETGSTTLVREPV